ncbi:MAG: MarR family transcriptional regulator [Dehalococcoidia bacterium]
MTNSIARPDVLPLSAVLGRIAHLLPKRISRWLGIGGPSLRVLFLAEQHDGISQSEIERHFELDGAAVTRLAKQLEADGLIRRVPDPLDNRYTNVHLSDAGHETLGLVRQRMHGFEAALYAGIAPEDLACCRDVLERIRENLASLPTAGDA